MGFKPVLHSLVDKGNLDNVKDVMQYSGGISGFTQHDKNAQSKQYTIVYSGMDDKLTDTAIDTVLKMDKFGGGDNEQAKKKYNAFSNNCQTFTQAVFKEYKKIWKENERKKHDGLLGFVKTIIAWSEHLKDITKDADKVVDFSSNQP